MAFIERSGTLKLAQLRRSTGYGQLRGSHHLTDDGLRALCGRAITGESGWIVAPDAEAQAQLWLADPRSRACTCARCWTAAKARHD